VTSTNLCGEIRDFHEPIEALEYAPKIELACCIGGNREIRAIGSIGADAISALASVACFTAATVFAIDRVAVTFKRATCAP
jgi:hypothetical protein